MKIIKLRETLGSTGAYTGVMFIGNGGLDAVPRRGALGMCARL